MQIHLSIEWNDHRLPEDWYQNGNVYLYGVYIFVRKHVICFMFKHSYYYSSMMSLSLSWCWYIYACVLVWWSIWAHERVSNRIQTAWNAQKHHRHRNGNVPFRWNICFVHDHIRFDWFSRRFFLLVVGFYRSGQQQLLLLHFLLHLHIYVSDVSVLSNRNDFFFHIGVCVFWLFIRFTLVDSCIRIVERSENACIRFVCIAYVSVLCRAQFYVVPA